MSVGDVEREEGRRALPIPLAALPTSTSARAWLAPRSDGARFHAGIDLGHADEPVLAPESGVVWGVIEASYAEDEPRFSRPRGWAGYGPRVVVLEGDSGAFHVLAHVDDPMVGVGQRVEMGDVLAVVAERGNHLHWEVRDRAQPPAGWATVEVSLQPEAWLAGHLRRWTREADGCPLNPRDTRQTPRACRPSSAAEYHAPSPAPELEVRPGLARTDRARPGVAPTPRPTGRRGRGGGGNSQGGPAGSSSQR